MLTMETKREFCTNSTVIFCLTQNAESLILALAELWHVCRRSTMDFVPHLYHWEPDSGQYKQEERVQVKLDHPIPPIFR